MRLTREPWLIALLTSLAWGSGSPACAVALRELPVSLVVAGRCGGAALILALFLRGRITTFWTSLSWSGRRKAVLAGALLGLHFLLFVGGVAYTTLPAAVTLVALEPVAIVLAGFIFFGIRPTPRQLGGITVAIAGALCVGFGSRAVTADAPTLGARHSWYGDALAVAAVIVYALYYAVNRDLKADADAATSSLTQTQRDLSLAAMIYASATLLALIFAAAVMPREAHAFIAPGPQGYAAVAVLAIVPTLIGHTLSQVASRLVSPIWIALMSPGETLCSVIVSMAFFGVYPSAPEALGGALIIFGALIIAL